MKKYIILFASLSLKLAFAAPHIELVNHYTFDFLNMSLSTQLVPLNDGGYIVQKYGRIITLFSADGSMLNEIEIAPMTPIYQKGTQLKDGRIIFINNNSLATVYDAHLTKISEYEIPAKYPWAPCLADNGKLVFGTYNEELIEIMDQNGNFSEIDDLGSHLKVTYCLENNKTMVMSADGLLSVIDISEDKAKTIFQKNYDFIDDTLKVMSGKAYFLTNTGLTILDLQDFTEESWPKQNLDKFIGVDYFSDGRYVLINSVRDEQSGAYSSRMIVYSKTGEKLGSATELKAGGTISPQVLIINDRYILTNHCSYNLVLYEFDNQLNEISRMPTKEFLCNPSITLPNGNLVFEGFSREVQGVYQIKLVE